MSRRRSVPGGLLVRGGLFLAALSPAATQAQEPSGRSATVSVYFNGSRVNMTDGSPKYAHGRLLVPLRAVIKSLPASAIARDPIRQAVTAAYSDRVVRIEIGRDHAWVNGRKTDLDVPAATIGGRTMVPLRFLSEALGAVVTHDERRKRVMVKMPVPQVPRGTVVASPETGQRRFFRRQQASTAPVITSEELLAALTDRVRADYDEWTADRAAWMADLYQFRIWGALETSFNSMLYFNGSSGLTGQPVFAAIPMNPEGWMRWQAVLSAYQQRDALHRQRLARDYADYVETFRKVFPDAKPEPMPILP